MTVKLTVQDYGNTKEILMFPDHYVAFAHTFLKDDAASTLVGGRKIVKAGTIYPANDATAKGVVKYDVDVTEGDQSGAIIVHGFIKQSAIPAAPEATAIAALPLIKFFPAIPEPEDDDENE